MKMRKYSQVQPWRGGGEKNGCVSGGINGTIRAYVHVFDDRRSHKGGDKRILGVEVLGGGQRFA